MATIETRMALPALEHSEAGALLRHWRTVRRLSQLDLSLQTGVSARHLSYVETGRSRPGRDLVLRLADALEIPLRERNALLAAAGHPPQFFETDLAEPAMAPVRGAIELILAHQEPYPAFLLDRHWTIRQANQAAARCSRFLMGGMDPGESNMIRLLLHPDLLRPVLVNWEDTAADLIRHLHHQVAAAPSDERARALLAEVLDYPGVPAAAKQREIGAPGAPLLTTVFRREGVELRFFSTLTTFGTPRDVALEELRIECSFPADDATAGRCRAMFAG